MKISKNMKAILMIIILAAFLFTGYAGGNDTALGSTGTVPTESETMETQTADLETEEPAQNEQETDGADRALLLYQG